SPSLCNPSPFASSQTRSPTVAVPCPPLLVVAHSPPDTGPLGARPAADPAPPVGPLVGSAVVGCAGAPRPGAGGAESLPPEPHRGALPPLVLAVVPSLLPVPDGTNGVSATDTPCRNAVVSNPSVGFVNVVATPVSADPVSDTVDPYCCVSALTGTALVSISGATAPGSEFVF